MIRIWKSRSYRSAKLIKLKVNGSVTYRGSKSGVLAYRNYWEHKTGWWLKIDAMGHGRFKLTRTK